jgi:metal-responsive CopG/Arc/MetJ family transcriptional regulator
MKVAVSVPDSLFGEADELAKRLNTTRSGLYCRALESFIREYRDEELTRRINEVCAEVDTSLPDDLRQAAVANLERVEWED